MSETDGGPQVEREDIGDVTVVRINVRMLMDDEKTEEVFGRIYPIIDDEGRRKLILNFSAIEYFASAAISKLVTLYRKVLSAGGKLALCNVASTVASILQMTHLSDVIIPYSDEREALRALA
jgi:anti-sigma B factor antagonist